MVEQLPACTGPGCGLQDYKERKKDKDRKKMKEERMKERKRKKIYKRKKGSSIVKLRLPSRQSPSPERYVSAKRHPKKGLREMQANLECRCWTAKALKVSSEVRPTPGASVSTQHCSPTSPTKLRRASCSTVSGLCPPKARAKAPAETWPWLQPAQCRFPRWVRLPGRLPGPSPFSPSLLSFLPFYPSLSPSFLFFLTISTEVSPPNVCSEKIKRQ